MKGIVVDINKNDAVILAEDGLFTKIKNENYSIGQTLHIKESIISLQPEKVNLTAAATRRFRASWKTGSKLLTGAASMAAVLAIGTIGAFAYYTPTDYVSLDVNPSVEYSINMFDRILDVNAVNDDGEKILSNLELNNKNIRTGIKETLDQLIANGYLEDGPEDSIEIATSNDQQDEAERLADELKQEVRTYLSSQKGVTAAVNAEAVGREKVQEAKELGVTPGKLTLVEKLEASSSGAINRDEWLKMPVKEINHTIKENRAKTGMKSYDPAQLTDNSSGNQKQKKAEKKQDQNPYESWNKNQAPAQDQIQNKNKDQSKNLKKNYLITPGTVWSNSIWNRWQNQRGDGPGYNWNNSRNQSGGDDRNNDDDQSDSRD